MPRPTTRRNATKRPTKWCGSFANTTVPLNTSLTVSDPVPLCTITNAAQNHPDPVVGWCRGSIDCSRLNGTDTNATVAWAIVMARLTVGSVTPVQIFDAFNVQDLERQDILGMGYLTIPPVVLIPSTDVAAINKGVITQQINIKVGRKLLRNSNNLFLWLSSFGGTDNSYVCRSSIRTLMKF